MRPAVVWLLVLLVLSVCVLPVVAGNDKNNNKSGDNKNKKSNNNKEKEVVKTDSKPKEKIENNKKESTEKPKKPVQTVIPQTIPPYPNFNTKNEVSIPVNKKLLDSPLADIQWMGDRDSTVLALTVNGKLYRSIDEGRTWLRQDEKLKTSKKKGSPAVDALFVSPVDAHYAFVMGTGKENWVTTNGGKTFEKCENMKIEDVKMHPTQKDWILVEALSKGCKSSGEGICKKTLYVSKDFGLVWKKVVDYVVQFDWAPAGHGDDTIYATVHKQSKKDDQVFGYWDPSINFVRSKDYFQSYEILVQRGNRFLFSEGFFLFVAQVADTHNSATPSNTVNLMINQDNVTTTHFDEAVVPEALLQHSYTILDTSEGMVFLHVNHHSGDSDHGHIYVSRADGFTFTLSLPYNRRDAEGKCDFERVQGLEGIYMANYLHSFAEAQIRQGDKFDEEQEHIKHRGKKYHGAPRTVISFDKGAAWSYLQPPSHDAYGNEIQCSYEDSCFLHLHGITDSYGPFYSEGNAIGLIMSTGTIGSHLHDYRYGVNTYFSKDAGLSWSEVASGSHIYEYGDHGSIIVMAPDDAPTDYIVYSWDQGASWTKLKISKVPIEIENVVIEPSATSEAFIIYGWQEEKGVLIHIDFADLHERPCTGDDAPGSSDSDYELWSPNDGRIGGQCLLGRTITYTRRKSASQCFNPQEYEVVAYYDHCTCTELDFECDEGFYREVSELYGSLSACKPKEGYVKDLSPPDNCNGYYEVTKGYRRIAGDSCLGGEEWEPTLVPCPRRLFGMAFIGKMVGGLAVLAFIGAVAHRFNDKHNVFGICLKNVKDRFPSVRYSKVSGIDDSEDFVGAFDDDDLDESAELFDNDLQDLEDLSSEIPVAQQQEQRDINFNLPEANVGDVDVPVLQPPPEDQL